MRLRTNQSGIALIAVLLLLVLAGIIGFAGWRVYDSQKSTSTSLDNSNKSDAAIIEQVDVEPKGELPKDSLTYTNNDLGFALKYPKDWKLTAQMDGKCGALDTEFEGSSCPLSLHLSPNDYVNAQNKKYGHEVGWLVTITVVKGVKQTLEEKYNKDKDFTFSSSIGFKKFNLKGAEGYYFKTSSDSYRDNNYVVKVNDLFVHTVNREYNKNGGSSTDTTTDDFNNFTDFTKYSGLVDAIVKSIEKL